MITKKFAGLTAALDEKGVSIFWPNGQLQTREILGNAGTDEHGRMWRNVFLPFSLWSFGFTEAELNSVGWATPLEISTRQPRYGVR